MSAAERDALYRLAARRPPPTIHAGAVDASEVRSMLDALAMPALVTDVAWDILAWNRAACELLLDPAEFPEDKRNAILLGFGPGSDLFPEDVPKIGRLVGWVRSAYLAEGGQSPALDGLIERMLKIPTAAEFWAQRALALEPVYETRVLASPGQRPTRVRTVRARLPRGLRLTQFIPIPPGREGESAVGAA
jgi:PAS domain-containing protein